MIYLLCLLLCIVVPVSAQTQYDIVTYDENDGLAQRYVTQIVQDRQGFIWIGTWNGLDRFDGYEFVNFKSTSDNGCNIPSDRIMNLRLSPDGNIYCLIDSRLFLFDTHSCRYKTVSKQVERRVAPLLCKDDNNKAVFPDRSDKDRDYYYCMTDRGGNRWYRSNYGICKAVPYQLQYKMLPQQGTSQVRFFFRDRKGRCWVTGKEDRTIRIYDNKEKLIGYLAPNGTLSTRPISFRSSIYCIYQDRKGNYWMGSKPDGLYRLTEHSGRFTISNYLYEPRSGQINNNSVYDIKEDSHGRLWIATFSKGLCCVENPEREVHFSTRTNGLSGYPTKDFYRVRNLLITKKGTLLAATTEGVIVADVRERNLGKIKFLCHTRNISDSSSLSNNATMSLYQDRNEHIFVCTESGGFNEIVSKNLLAPRLKFKRYNTTTGFPTDVVLTLHEYGTSLWAVSNDKLIKIDKGNRYTVFGNEFFRNDIRFSDAIPLPIANGRCLFGLQNGALSMNLDSLQKSRFIPTIAITGYSIQNCPMTKTAANGDSILLSDTERSLTICFAALDFASNRNLEYSFSLDGKEWNDIGQTHSVTFLDLPPGKHILRIRSTNHDGLWVDNTRTITITVTPTFWQTTFARVLYFVFALALLCAIYYTLLYINRINARNKNLKAYLAIIEMKESTAKQANDGQFVDTRETELLEEAKIKAADDVFMRRIVTYVEQHIADPDANIDSMAEATATSRAGLNRKMKTILGITPMDFLREVRIQRACTMLQDKSASINDIALRCGFADARYFSRIFKAKKGITPSEYRNTHITEP